MILVIIMHNSCITTKDWGTSVRLEGMGMHFSPTSAYANKGYIWPDNISQ